MVTEKERLEKIGQLAIRNNRKTEDSLGNQRHEASTCERGSSGSGKIPRNEELGEHTQKTCWSATTSPQNLAEKREERQNQPKYTYQEPGNKKYTYQGKGRTLHPVVLHQECM